jgi:hypothetical protein
MVSFLNSSVPLNVSQSDLSLQVYIKPIKVIYEGNLIENTRETFLGSVDRWSGTVWDMVDE